MYAIAIVRDYKQLCIYMENMFRFQRDSIEHSKICFSSNLWKLYFLKYTEINWRFFVREFLSYAVKGDFHHSRTVLKKL